MTGAQDKGQVINHRRADLLPVTGAMPMPDNAGTGALAPVCFFWPPLLRGQ